MLLEKKVNNLPKLMYGIFAWVGWPNIGLAAADTCWTCSYSIDKEHFLLIGREVHWEKKMGCFNHRVVTLFAVKLRRQWLREVYFGIRD